MAHTSCKKSYMYNVLSNISLPSCLKPLFKSEVKYEALDIKMIFNSHPNRTHFRKKDFALSLVFSPFNKLSMTDLHPFPYRIS